MIPRVTVTFQEFMFSIARVAFWPSIAVTNDNKKFVLFHGSDMGIN